MLLIFLTFALQGCYSQNQRQILDQSKVTDPYSWDFGQVREGEVLEHIFVLKNESKRTLNIKELNTSCACTVSEVKKKTLLPGEETLIEVKFDTKGYLGPTKQFIYLHTDDVDKPIIRFIISVDIIKN